MESWHHCRVKFSSQMDAWLGREAAPHACHPESAIFLPDEGPALFTASLSRGGRRDGPKGACRRDLSVRSVPHASVLRVGSFVLRFFHVRLSTSSVGGWFCHPQLFIARTSLVTWRFVSSLTMWVAKISITPQAAEAKAGLFPSGHLKRVRGAVKLRVGKYAYRRE